MQATLESIFSAPPVVDRAIRDHRQAVIAAVEAAKAGNPTHVMLRAMQGDITLTCDLSPYLVRADWQGKPIARKAEGIEDRYWTLYRPDNPIMEAFDFAGTRHCVSGRFRIYVPMYPGAGWKVETASPLIVVGETDLEIVHPEHAPHMWPAGVPLMLGRQTDTLTNQAVWD